MIAWTRRLCCYSVRRQQLVQTIRKSFNTDKFCCVIDAGKFTYRSPDVVNKFKPRADYFYLTGFTEPECVLTIDEQSSSTIYIPTRNQIELRFDGPIQTEACAISQKFKVRPLSDLTDILIKTKRKIFFSSDNNVKFDKQRLSNDLRPTIHKMRRVKDTHEQALIKNSCQIMCNAITEAMKHEHRNEADIDIMIEQKVRKLGAHMAFIPVVASGSNAADAIHYQKNDSALSIGQSVLVDAGCEYFNYCSDISRTFLNNGRSDQDPMFCELYNVVLDVQEYLIDQIQLYRDKCTLYDLYVAMLKQLVKLLHDRKILACPPSIDVAMDLCPHDVGHHLGIDVHDAGMSVTGEVLRTGNVITVEPGLYISRDCKHVKPEFRGYAIRIEDDILITEDSVKNLTISCPKTLTQIQALVCS
ncbi:hypothetical protein GJ496_010640 [Pomphorhynchus laevis]|nr:hypothetical protein GJ496_010640 [Pomphorhynchus laevis]